MTITKKKLKLHSPSVSMTSSRYGHGFATLSGYREKRDGSIEEWEIEFGELEQEAIACIGRSAVRTLREIRQKQDERTQQKLTFVTGWTEGEMRD